MTAPVHIYRSNVQPLTRFRDTNLPKPMLIKIPGNRLHCCHKCEKLRPAKNLGVQVYYDRYVITCSPGKGCRKGKKP